MPNWCENRVTIWNQADGDDAVRRLMAFVKSEERSFDFNKIIPMPSALDGIISGSCTIDGVTVRNWREVDGEAVAVSDEELETLRAEHQATNWYDWCVGHWDTKWNACHESEPEVSEWNGKIESVEYRFDTAWCPPEAIYHKLRELFPEVGISWFYDEPGCEIAGYLGND